VDLPCTDVDSGFKMRAIVDWGVPPTAAGHFKLSQG
jgi:hypothetical protein